MKKKKPSLKPKGFSLLEVLIATAIVVVVAAVGITAFNQYAASNEVLQQTQELKSLARKLKTDATAATKTGDCTIQGVIYGTYITFKKPNQYTYGVSCFKPEDNPDTTSFSTKQTKTLETGLEISSNLENLTIVNRFDGTTKFYDFQFNPDQRSHLTSPPAALTEDPLFLEVTNNQGTSYRLYFYSTGLVCEQKGTTSTQCPE